MLNFICSCPPSLSLSLSHEPAEANRKKKKPITLKRLIRLCHIAEPAQEVMSILGRKYPATAEEFAKSGLKGYAKSSPVSNQAHMSSTSRNSLLFIHPMICRFGYSFT